LPQSTVTVLNCGGTINMSGSAGARPDDMVARNLGPVQRGLPRPLRVVLSSPFTRPPDSSNMGAEAWWVIVQAIQAELDRRDAALEAAGLSRGAGIVVTHGTDTMAVTSLLVALETAHRRLRVPIVFTGSHATPDQPGSDAIQNLTRAIALAGPGDLEVLPPGVFVVIGQDVHLASRLTKVETAPDRNGRYFSSFPAAVGQVTGGGARLKLDRGFLDGLQSHARPPSLRCTGRFGHVEHIVVDCFTPPRVLADLSRRLTHPPEGRRPGVVVQGNFVGSPHFDVHKAVLVELAQSGVAVAIGSRAVFEHVGSPSLPIALLHRSLSHPAARLKLTWLLGTALSLPDVLRLLSVDLVGEIFETDALPEWIAYETYPDQRPGTEVVIVVPDLDRQVIDDAADRLVAHRRARKDLHLYGFGHGHIPGPNAAVADLFVDWAHARGLEVPASLREAADLWSLTEAVTDHLAGCDVDALHDWLLGHYRPQEAGLRHAVHNAQARRRRQTLQAQLRDWLEHSLSLFEHDTRVNLRDVDGLIAHTVDAARFRGGGRGPELSHLSAPELLRTALSLAPGAIARRLIKDAVMAASPLHAAVGRATDLGVRVHPRTQVTRGTPDPTRYEAGTLLVAVGAGGRGPLALPWRQRALLPR